MIYDYFRVTGALDTVLDCADLFSVTLRDDNMHEFDTRWNEVLVSMTKISSDEILGSLYKLRIRESDQLKTVLEWYDMVIHQKISVPNYQKLKTMVKVSMDQKLRLRNSDARHERIEPGAVVKSRKWLIGVEGGNGLCHQWKKKASVRKETVAVSATKPKIGRNNLWRMFCAGFRHSAGFHARVVLDGATCRLGGLGEVEVALGVLGVDRVVPIVVRVLVSW